MQAVYSASCRREGQGELVETSVTFPGLPAIVPSARRFVRGILDDSPRADDMELIAGELISNAILHSPAGEPGGEFTVTIRTGSLLGAHRGLRRRDWRVVPAARLPARRR